ncbi:hypothetical protein E2562_012370 [Oryza meyeriana var. granulata]|uniref:DUF668 domain-containing protein n=1 Tax=Oryza meyeriana var. granulata TaxID=110450 RepID=A0A6G1C584_9ORYZ|nr:hypothetical protein E2562_012370 [Oryza meyeriana var. granulata]
MEADGRQEEANAERVEMYEMLPAKLRAAVRSKLHDWWRDPGPLDAGLAQETQGRIDSTGANFRSVKLKKKKRKNILIWEKWPKWHFKAMPSGLDPKLKTIFCAAASKLIKVCE